MAKKTTLNEQADIYQKRDRQSEREKLKDMTRQQKWTYFKDYYLLKTVTAIFFTAFFGYVLFVTFAPKPNTAVYIAGINLSINSEAKDKFIEAANAYLNLDPETDSITFDYSNTLSDNPESYIYNLTTSEKLAAVITSKELDIMIIDRKNFDTYVAEGFFTNLSDTLTPATFSALSDYFIMGKTEDDIKENPYGISLDESEVFKSIFSTTSLKPADGQTQDELLESLSKDYVLGIITNSQRKETSAQMVEFLFAQ